MRLSKLPTPFEEVPRFSEALGGPRIFVKRDDATSLALGGNKEPENSSSFWGRRWKRVVIQ